MRNHVFEKYIQFCEISGIGRKRGFFCLSIVLCKCYNCLPHHYVMHFNRKEKKCPVDLTAVWQQKESWAKLLTPGSQWQSPIDCDGAEPVPWEQSWPIWPGTNFLLSQVTLANTAHFFLCLHFSVILLSTEWPSFWGTEHHLKSKAAEGALCSLTLPEISWDFQVSKINSGY